MSIVGLILLSYVLIFVLSILSLVVRVKRRTGMFSIIHNNSGAYGFVDKIVLVSYVSIIGNAFLFAFSYVPSPIFLPLVWLAHPLLQIVGLILIGISLLLMYIAQLQMGDAWRIGIDTEQRDIVVEQGLFRYFRHPIYFFAVLIGGSAVLAIPTTASIVVFVFLYVALSVQARLEEEHMLSQFGERYETFMRSHRRWF